eukprot:3806238-Prymnesium_polylepis.1
MAVGFLYISLEGILAPRMSVQAVLWYGVVYGVVLNHPVGGSRTGWFENHPVGFTYVCLSGRKDLIRG